MQVAPPLYPTPSAYHPYAMNSLQRDHQPIYQQVAQQQPPPIPPSSSISSRKRKRPPQNPNSSYHVEKGFDDSGGMREYLVIDDTPPPQATPSGIRRTPAVSAAFTPAASSAGIRTRAQVAAAASQESLPPILPPPLSYANGHGAAVPPAKRRKKETFVDEPHPNAVLAGSSRHVNGNGNGVAGPSSGAYARKAMAARAYDNPNHTAPGASATSWGAQGSGGTAESVRASQASQASAQAQQVPSPLYDDKDGYYIITPNDMIGTPARYRVVKQLGQGTFGKVVEAHDCYEQKRVAVKIIRAIPKYRDASKIEIRVLKTLKNADPANLNKCIHLEDWFDFRNHVCIVTELLGLCIYDFLRENQFESFPRRHIQNFASQLLQGVAFLHHLNLIHTDLKPENILLVDSGWREITYIPQGSRSRTQRTKRILNNTEVRLIDFGSATFDDEYHPTVVSTRHYRAPEIILGLGWTFPCDAFSLGCILVEFYTGGALFQTHDNLEHLAMMEAAMGKMPITLAKKAARTKAEFFKIPASANTPPSLDYPKPKISRASRREVKAVKPLEDTIKQMDVINMRFLDVVKKLLAWEVNDRIKVKDALTHPYFNLDIPLGP